MAGACVTPDEVFVRAPREPHWTDGLTEAEKALAKKAYDKGYEEGRRKGFEEGRERERQFQKEVKEALSRW